MGDVWAVPSEESGEEAEEGEEEGEREEEGVGEVAGVETGERGAPEDDVAASASVDVAVSASLAQPAFTPLPRVRALPRADLVAGLGEVVKCGFVADPEILRLVETSDPDELVAGSGVLRELVERAIQVKIDVVVGDLRERGDGGLAAAFQPA